MFTRLLIAAVAASATLVAQTPPDPAVAEVRKTLEAARKELDSYKAAGGTAAAEHPALRWEAALWGYRDRYPRTDAAALAAAEAVRVLVRAGLWSQAHARVDAIAVDDAAWIRLAPVVYEEGIARKDLPAAIDRLSRAAAATTNPAIKSAVLLVVGRAYRRHGDNAAAIRALAAARDASPGTQYAEQADGLIYEITHLSVGLPAPPVAGKSRTGGAVDLAALRGTPVVLVFWGTS